MTNDEREAYYLAMTHYDESSGFGFLRKRLREARAEIIQLHKARAKNTQLRAALRAITQLRAALSRIANINNGPDRASGEYRCLEAAAIANAALTNKYGAAEPSPEAPITNSIRS